MPSAAKKIFFDLDGTLTDSREGIIKCIQHALSKMGLPSPPEDDLTGWIGPPLQVTFARQIGAKSQNEVDRVMSFYRERYVEVGIYENRIYDGICDLLSRLRNGRFPLYLVTSKPLVYAQKVIDEIELRSYFECIYGSELDGRRTDKADLIHYVLEKEMIQPENAIMIGDRAHDIVSATANRVEGIGVSWGYGSVEELEEAGAIHICHTPDSLFELLKRFSQEDKRHDAINRPP
jgi:phosphoglycolate phosphatase